ncbi:hypothetical protein BFP70_10690 [Thioclava sp. SK-1]|uniref:SMP-30/gluconolactonase/LRE family protein n=1 Tax=Thioclava sp. SK-1 TaxID=1889770 RepID=UPI000824AA37|nr:SMP-30/gluconolactonase/LRE family protein [Thioclava sp. SK-1]OCX64503.1 hypothetical protein BFP70_10690 [Thioclava sp. SK-1]
MTPLDHKPCALGEGALWHPGLKRLFWFDITGQRLLSHDPATGMNRDQPLPEMFSAAGWVDDDTMVLASQSALWRYRIDSHALHRLLDLEADNTLTRSNDGRADPHGGFWIGTMGRRAQPGAGAIYRYWRGTLRSVVQGITIPNAICFSPDGTTAYYADTPQQKIFAVGLNAQGWPDGPERVFADLAAHGLNPDGAITDALGRLHVACWGDGAVHVLSPDGAFIARHPVPVPHVTCPAFGGAQLDVLFCTSATEGMSAQALNDAPLAGTTFALHGSGAGRAEPAIDLSHM